MTEDRRRPGGPPEDTLPDRIMARIWNGWGRILHKLLGPYYDPSERLAVASLLGLGLMSVHSLSQGIDGALGFIGFVGVFTASYLYFVYWREQRWRA